MNRIVTIVAIAVILMMTEMWHRELVAREELELELAQLVEDAQSDDYSRDVQEIQAMETAAPLPTAVKTIAPEPSPTSTPPLSEMSQYGIESRVSAIGKFIQLNDEQKERLREKYRSDALARREGSKPTSESLDSIIGESNAQFFRDQVKNAYQKAQQQELDRELYYLSRKLNFSSDQESKVRQALAEVETQVTEKFKTERASEKFASDASYRVRISIQENQFRTDWLAQQLKGILGADQYQAYVQEEAESSAADMGIFHAP